MGWNNTIGRIFGEFQNLLWKRKHDLSKE
jgi:hypothetical protein